MENQLNLESTYSAIPLFLIPHLYLRNIKQKDGDKLPTMNITLDIVCSRSPCGWVGLNEAI